MECVSKLDSCPGCHTPLVFKDGTATKVVKDDNDLIESDDQRKAIQQRWALKRLAEADKDVSNRERNAVMPDKDQMIAKLMRDTEKYSRGNVTSPKDKEIMNAAQTVQEKDEVSRFAPEPQENIPSGQADEQLVPEELPMSGQKVPEGKTADDKKAKLKQILDNNNNEGNPDEQNNGSRDITRL